MSAQAAGKAIAGAAKAAGARPSVLQKGAKRDPELYVLMAVMAGAFGLAGFYFGSKPTSASSEYNVKVAEESMPWHAEEGKKVEEIYKYQYHPGGDPSKAPRNAPSALHSVIIPKVNLPKELHDKFNKWGKDEY